MQQTPGTQQEPATPGAPAAPPRLQIVSEEARDLADRLLRDQKQRWASEIHDGLTQTVTAAVLELERLRGRLRSDPASAEATLDEVVEQLRSSLDEVREALFELSGDADLPPEGDAPGRALAATIEEVARRFGVRVSTDLHGPIDALPPSIVATAAAVVREALTNAAKHSGATELRVRTHAGPDGLTVEVEDHGRGFPDGDPEAGHLGMRMMRRRLDQAGGFLVVRSAPGAGTSVIAHIPARSGAIR